MINFYQPPILSRPFRRGIRPRRKDLDDAHPSPPQRAGQAGKGRDLFKNRQEAGEKLAQALEKYKNGKTLILAIPRGGVAVGASIATKLKAPLDVIGLRKLPIPWSDQMGFGAIISDGTTLLNEEVVRSFGITPEVIEQVKKEVLEEVKRREKIYRGKGGFPSVKGKTVILVDDGLATGFSMLAACQAVRKHKPKKIIVAVPVSPLESFERVKPHADELVCLYVEKGAFSFAVASYYQDFPDLTDEEVIEKLKTLP